MSLNSYGYNGQQYMQGPVFDSDTASLYSAAQNATANQKIG